MNGDSVMTLRTIDDVGAERIVLLFLRRLKFNGLVQKITTNWFTLSQLVQFSYTLKWVGWLAVITQQWPLLLFS
ncbi:MAG: hypothetical protein DID91_2727703702 [Candidatus Nitrotoga sp. MKT]|nr:MAG: hypothetical protein DID91_2727703702 [Candidatus Nitrotoga sp. MKT]